MDMEKWAASMMVDKIEEMFGRAFSGEVGQRDCPGFSYREIVRSLLYVSSHIEYDTTIAVSFL